jgi:hypothetical protein
MKNRPHKGEGTNRREKVKELEVKKVNVVDVLSIQE